MNKPFIRNRKMRYGSITAVLTVLVVAVTVLSNAVVTSLVERYGWYGNMNTTGMFDVTEDCYDFLEDVFATATEGGREAEVEILFCDLPAHFEDEPTQSQLYHTALSLQERFPQHVKVQCYDILSNPNTVRDYASTTDPHTGELIPIALETTSVILVSEGYHRAYTLAEFFSFKENSADLLWAYNGERKLAAGIMRAVTPNRPTACLTNNHGEVYFDYEILYLLDDAGYNVTYLDLYQGQIPADCSLIVSYNPTADLVEDRLSAVSEIEVLEEFLSHKGNAFWVFMGNASPALPNYERFLDGWGADFAYHTSNGNAHRYMVQDTSQTLTSDGYTIYGEHTATGADAPQVADRYAIFKNATAIRPAAGYQNLGNGRYQKGNRELMALYTGGENAVAWANGQAVSEADSAILMSVTRQTLDEGSSYVCVIASAELATEKLLQSAVYGNADVLCSVLEYQGREHTPRTLIPKPYEQTEISTVTTRQMLIWTLTLTLTPAVLVTAVALVVLIRRRRA